MDQPRDVSDVRIDIGGERQLQRGIPLAPMPPREPRAPAAGTAPVPSTADLDAMFGVFTGALPDAPASAPAPAPAPAPTGLQERMRSAFTADMNCVMMVPVSAPGCSSRRTSAASR